ncbi:MAG TPA: hypothetical protein VH309_13260 [Elusimicrobiota bacterium]|jgi:hypothetical protein|nr:hypothetical protein [Elusimicrobiota bacterium]
MGDIDAFIRAALLGPSPRLFTMVLGALSIVVAGVLVTRFVDKKGSGRDSTPQPGPGGKTLTIGGTTYGLRTAELSGVSTHWILSLPVGVPHTFSVQRENGLERLIEHLGALSVIETGDAHFDEEFEVRTREAVWTGAFLADEENRRLVRELFGLDAVTVMLSGGLLEAAFDQHDALDEGGPALSELAARLPKDSAPAA